jgi:hypothetical protein
MVRGESPIRAELYDMFSTVKKYEGLPVHDAHILIIQIEKPMQARLCGGVLCAINM